MHRAHKIKINPTSAQAAFLTQCCHANRFAFNWGLAKWQADYRNGLKPKAMQIKKAFTDAMDAECAWIRETCRDAYASAFFAFEDAFSHFFKKQNGYPKFKSRKRARMSFALANDKIYVSGFKIKLPKIGSVNMTESLRYAGRILSATISTKAGQWFVSVLVEIERQVKKAIGRRVGVDVGIKSLAVTSEGEAFENQEPLRQQLVTLKRLSQHLSRKVLYSQNWHKCKAKVQRLHLAIRNRRMDALHKATAAIVNGSEAVFVEDLNVAGMLKNHRLALSLSDAAMSEFHRQLAYKCEWRGAFFGKINRFAASSKTCNVCGVINDALTLADRVWTCKCGSVHDRDVNAAKNIRDWGIGLHLT